MRVPAALAPAALLAIVLAAGCAPAVPALLGGRVTPRGAADVALGGASRIPLGDLAPRPAGDELVAFAEPGGVAPVASVRVGFLRRWSAGAFLSPSTVRLEVLGEARLGSSARLVGGLFPYGGYASTGLRQEAVGGEGYRLGVLAPLALAIDIAGLAEAWLGLRAGFEQVEGWVGAGARAAGHLSAFRGGGVLGLALGLRRVHFLAELSVDYERWIGALDNAAIDREGVALTPAFGVRVRF